MRGGFPDWQPFSLEAESSSPLELSGMRGSTLVLLAAPAVDEAGWAVRAAARIAEQRASRNGRLVLADLDLRQPRLHMQLGADNGEGMSDVLLWGASIPRVALPLDAGFHFTPAGTAVADTGSVLSSPRWESLLEGFEEAGVELFLYVPWDAPGRDAVLSRARNVVVLAARPELDRLDVPEVDGLRVGAVLGPEDDGHPSEPAGEPAPPEEVAAPAAEVPGPAEPAVVAAPAAPEPGAAAEPPSPAPGMAEPAPDDPPPAPGPPAPEPPPTPIPASDLRVESVSGGRSPVLIVAVVLVLVAVVVALAVAFGLL